MPKTVAVIDGNSFMHRAYHAVPPTMQPHPMALQLTQHSDSFPCC